MIMTMILVDHWDPVGEECEVEFHRGVILVWLLDRGGIEPFDGGGMLRLRCCRWVRRRRSWRMLSHEHDVYVHIC